jgi:hypothetical protein
MAIPSTKIIVNPQKTIDKCKYELADIKLQQCKSLQQQIVLCNNCKKYTLEMLENTMKT